MAPIGIASLALWTLRDEIGRALDATPVRWERRRSADLAAVLIPAGPPGEATRRAVERRGLACVTVEPGPFRCLRPGLPDRPLSLRIGGWAGREDAGHGDVAASLARWRALRLSRRNDGRDRLPSELESGPIVLAVAERGGPSDANVLAARAGHPDLPIAVLSEGGEGAFALPGARTFVETGRLNPHALYDRAVAVFAAQGSWLGTEASLAGVDRTGSCANSRRSVPDRDVASAFLDDVFYLDPWTREPIGFDEAAEKLAWLRDRFHDNDRPTVCVGVSGWKRRQVAGFLEGPDGPPRFETSSERAASLAADAHGRVVAWDTRMPAALPAACQRAGVPLERMEDGFLRSVGLGAAFRPGASAVLDRSGIYYDPSRPSDCERILAKTSFSPDLLARAEALRQSIVTLRLSKYNVGARRDLNLPAGRRLVLVPGQVEDDASVQRGSPVVRTNLALLEAARAANPDAFLIFKPHPDVAAGLRQGRVGDADAREFADLVVEDVAIADLLDDVHAVETMTSLTGFEALLRGIAVAAHGQPFYAGWGLTTDRHPPAGRTRRLSLDELVAGALILYPRYLDPVTGLRCEPELLVRRLAEARDHADRASAGAARARALYVRLRYAVLGPLAALIRRSRGTGPSGR